MQILVFTAFNVLCKLKKHTTCDIYILSENLRQGLYQLENIKIFPANLH